MTVSDTPKLLSLCVWVYRKCGHLSFKKKETVRNDGFSISVTASNEHFLVVDIFETEVTVQVDLVVVAGVVMNVALTLITKTLLFSCSLICWTALRIQEMSVGSVGGNVHHKLYSEKLLPRHQFELKLIIKDTHKKVDSLSLY